MSETSKHLPKNAHRADSRNTMLLNSHESNVSAHLHDPLEKQVCGLLAARQDKIADLMKTASMEI